MNMGCNTCPCKARKAGLSAPHALPGISRSLLGQFHQVFGPSMVCASAFSTNMFSLTDGRLAKRVVNGGGRRYNVDGVAGVDEGLRGIESPGSYFLRNRCRVGVVGIAKASQLHSSIVFQLFR